MRHIFIGDIHGCYDEFLDLIQTLKVSKYDTVYILGDMINRGPKSQEVLEFLYKNQENYFAIKGNHEIGFLQYLSGEKPEYENSIYLGLKDFMGKNPDILNYLQKLPLYIEEEQYRIIHAGTIPTVPFVETPQDIASEIYFYKELPWYFSYGQDEKLLFYGHWAADGVHIRTNTIGLDSGCVSGGKLSAYILEEQKLIQIPARKIYFKSGNQGYGAELKKKGIYT